MFCGTPGSPTAITLEQLTYLIFLKMMYERSQPPYTLLPGLRGRRQFQRDTTGPACWPKDARQTWRPTTGIHFGDAGAAARHAGCYFQQGAEQDSGAGDADAADQGV